MDTENVPEAPQEEENAKEAASTGDLPILGAGIYSSTDNFNSYLAKAIANSSDGVFQVNVDDGQLDQTTQLNQIDTALAKGVLPAPVCFHSLQA